MLKKYASFVLASLDGHCEHPAWLLEVVSHVDNFDGLWTPREFFSSLLGQKCCNRLDHLGLLRHGQFGIDRNGDGFVGGPFRLREVPRFVAQIPEAFLQMERNRIVCVLYQPARGSIRSIIKAGEITCTVSAKGYSPSTGATM